MDILNFLTEYYFAWTSIITVTASFYLKKSISLAVVILTIIVSTLLYTGMSVALFSIQAILLVLLWWRVAFYYKPTEGRNLNN